MTSKDELFEVFKTDVGNTIHFIGNHACNGVTLRYFNERENVELTDEEFIKLGKQYYEGAPKLMELARKLDASLREYKRVRKCSN